MEIINPSDSKYKDGTLDQIYNDPLTPHALDLFERFSKRGIAGEGLASFLNTLPSEAEAERAKLEGLLSNGSLDGEIDLSSRAGQLVWAAGLAHVFQSNPPGTVRNSPLWRALTSNPKISGSLGASARFIDLSITNRNATMDWGTPGSWFWFAPDKNHVNIDLFHTLLTGFADDPAPGVHGMAHAAGVMMHEVGHSQLTTRFTDKMQALREREQALLESSKERKLTLDEFKELARVRTEFSLRMNVMNAAEDNCVNQYAANHSREFPHDFGGSLNICNILLQGSGHYLKKEEGGHTDNSLQELLKKLMTGAKQKQVEAAGKAFADLNKAIALSFYATNGLFDRADEETWKRLGIDPDDIRAAETPAAQSAADHFLNSGKSDFERLLDLNVGPSGMSAQQPQIRDRQLLRSIFARSIETYADRRCRIIDEIWDKYAAPHAEILINAAEEDAQNRMDQKKQQNDQNGQENNQSQSGGQGQEQDQQASGGQSSESANNADDASPSQGGGSSSGQENNQGGEQSSKQSGQAGEKGADQKTAEEKDGQSRSSGSQSEQSANEQDDPSPQGGDGSKVDVEGVGEMEVDGGKQALPSSPEEARQKQRAKENRGQDDIDPQNSQTVRDLAREAKRQEKQANPANDDNKGQDSGQTPSYKEGQGKPDLNMDGSSSQGGRDRGVDLADLAANADWREWRRETGKLEPVIRRVADDFSYIRDRQKQKTRSLSKQRETLPRGNNLRERLDMAAHMNLAVKRATGQRIEEPDLRRWRMDQVEMEPTSVELWILTDGSGSMEDGLPGGGRRIDSAVQSMAVLFEAGRRADFDVFAGMWGDERLRLLASPSDRDQDIGEKFQRVRNGIGSGTQLSPSFGQAIERSAKQETGMDGKQKRFAGMTHFLILSDGDLNHGDIDPLVKMITKLFKHGPAVSVDIAVLGDESGSEMNSVVSQVKRENPRAAIDLIRATNAKDIPVLLAQKIKRRFERSVEDLKAVPDAQKREAFTRAHRAIMSAYLG